MMIEYTARDHKFLAPLHEIKGLPVLTGDYFLKFNRIVSIKSPV